MTTMISHRKQFIFIHIYKTAGSSITSALSEFDNHRILNNPFIKNLRIRFAPSSYNMFRSTLFPDHVTALYVKNSVQPRVFNEFFKFAFVRNPWDWQVSMYHYIKRARFYRQHNVAKKMSFENYVTWRVENDVRLQKRFVVDENDNVLVDYIGKFENLESDFAYICQELDIRKTLPHIKKSERRSYRTYYNDRTANMIYDAFRKDIDFFDYQF